MRRYRHIQSDGRYVGFGSSHFFSLQFPLRFFYVSFSLILLCVHITYKTLTIKHCLIYNINKIEDWKCSYIHIICEIIPNKTSILTTTGWDLKVREEKLCSVRMFPSELHHSASSCISLNIQL